MKQFFFSSRNVSRQNKELEKLLNISNKGESKKKCKKFLIIQMEKVFEKYKDKRPNDMPIQQFIDLLNKKSIQNCKKK